MTGKAILVTAGYDHSIRFWDAPNGVCYRTIQFEGSQVNVLRITPDKTYLAVAAHSVIKLFDIKSNNPDSVTSYEGHNGNVTSLGFQKHGKWMFTGSEDGSVKIWDLRAPGCQCNYECKSPVNTVALHPNQAELISGDSSGRVSVWDLTANKLSTSTKPEADVSIRSLDFAPDASVAVGCNNAGNAFIWNISQDVGGEYNLSKTVRVHDTYALKIVVSPDAKTVATTSSDRTAKLWNLQDMSLQTTLVGHQRWVWDCAFSADSSFIVTASSDNSARLWNVSTGEVVKHYTGHHKPIVCVALDDSVDS